MGRVVSPTPTPLSLGRVVPALVASYNIHGRAGQGVYSIPNPQGILLTAVSETDFKFSDITEVFGVGC